MMEGLLQASKLQQSVEHRVRIKVPWLRILALGVAVCLLSACSTPQPSHNSLTLEDLWATANVERVDGGVTYVNRSFYGSGFSAANQFFWFPAGHQRYQPRWMGGFHPYYSLYYPYYGYRPHYVWECPVDQHPNHPAHQGPVVVAGQPILNPGPVVPVQRSNAPVSEYQQLNNIPLVVSPYVALEPGIRYRVGESYLGATLANPGMATGQSPNLTSQLGRPTESTSGAMAGLNARPGGNDTLRTLQRPEPVRYSRAGSQRYSSGRGSYSRPTRSISRSPRASISRSVNVSSNRSEAQR